MKVETEVKQTNEALQILVVEDYSLIAMLLVETLAEMGEGECQWRPPRPGGERRLRCRPNLILADAHLRDDSGDAAIDERLRSGSVPELSASVRACSMSSVKKAIST